MVQKPQTTTWDAQNPVNNGIDYQPQVRGICDRSLEGISGLSFFLYLFFCYLTWAAWTLWDSLAFGSLPDVNSKPTRMWDTQKTSHPKHWFLANPNAKNSMLHHSYIAKCVQSYFNTPIHTCFVGDQHIISKIAGLSFFLRLFFLYLILSSAGRFIERDTILKPSTHAMWNLTRETPVKCPYWRWLCFVVTPYPMLKDSGAGSLCPRMLGNHDVYWVRYVDLALTLTWLSPYRFKRTKTTQF